TESGALAALAGAGAEVYSLGQPSNFAPGDPGFGTPNTFVFGFSGVGGTHITDISLAPDGTSDPVGSDHTVTATVSDNGSPVVGTAVSFNILDGPNSDGSGTCVPVDCTTAADGTVSFTYTGSGGTGTDHIQASFVDPTSQTQVSNIVSETWTEGSSTPDVPIPVTPPDGSTTKDNTPTFSWSNESASGATSYH